MPPPNQRPASRNDQPSVHWTVPGRTTFALQSSLPPLPLPSLDETIARYLKSVTPLLSSAELAHTTALAEAFVRGEGAQLQAALQARAAGCCAERGYPHVHWLEEWWDRYAYLSDRTPLPVRYNIFGTLFGGQGTPDGGGRLRRAAQLLRGAALFYLQLRAEAISPDSLDTKGSIPLCMFQFRRLFGSSRVPGEAEDCITTAAGPISHVAVLCRGRAWSLRIIDGLESGSSTATDPSAAACSQPAGAAPNPSAAARGEPSLSDPSCRSGLGEGTVSSQPGQGAVHVASVTEIAAGLAAIEQAAAAAGDNSDPACLLSSLPRHEWAGHRSAIERDCPANAASLRAIESSLLSLSLCSDAPHDMPALCKATHEGGGGGGCVWYDKPLTFIVFANGKAGAHMEHAHFDAPITSRAFAFMARASDDEPAEPEREDPEAACAAASGSSSTSSSSSIARVTPAPFDLSRLPSVRVAMPAARASFAALSRNNALVPVRFDGAGGRALRAAKLPPDSIVQLALQLAQRRDQGSLVATYETATTRRFLHGRTETIRSCTVEAAAFVRAIGRLADAGGDSDAAGPGGSAGAGGSLGGGGAVGEAGLAGGSGAEGGGTGRGDGAAEQTSVEQVRAEARQALAAALKAHMGLLVAASSGHGVDRHLMGLRLAAATAGLPPPALFTDVGYTRSTCFALSTSNMSKPGLANPTDDYAGFGAPTAGSYGVCYDVRDEGIRMLVSSDRSSGGRDAARFGREILRALADVCALALGGQAQPHSRL
jgi:carnitine O-acetyltransferase